MKIILEDPSSGKDAIAEESVLNCPVIDVSGFTTTAPSGGDVLLAACAKAKRPSTR